MKRILFLLLFLPFLAFSQVVPPNATPLENIQITNNIQSTTATRATVSENNGVLNYIPIQQLPITNIPVNYSISAPQLGSHLAGIDTRLGQISSTKENVSNKATDFTTINNTLYPTTQAVKNFTDGLVNGTINYFPIFTTANTIGNSLMSQAGGKILFNGVFQSVAGSTHASFAVNRTLTTIDFHAFEDFSTLNTTDKDLGYCSFDAKTTMNNSLNQNHLVGYQSRNIYNGSANLTSYMHGYDVEMGHTGSGTIANVRGIRIRDVQGTGIITNNYGIYIEDITRATAAANNYAIYSEGGKNYFGGEIKTPLLLSQDTSFGINYGVDTSGKTINVGFGTAGQTQFGKIDFYNGKNGLMMSMVGSTGNVSATGTLTAASLIKSGGLTSQFLKANGDSDSTVYAPLNSPGLTGNPTAPTPAAGDNDTSVATTAFVQTAVVASTRPYKTYVALLSQTGTSAPTATVLENTYGTTMTLARISAGSYSIGFSGAFVANKTVVIMSMGSKTGTSVYTVRGYYTNNSIVSFGSQDAGIPADDLLDRAVIEIRTYL